MGKAGRPRKHNSQQTSQIHSRYKATIVAYVKCDKCQMNIRMKGITANKNHALANHYRVCQSSATRNMMTNNSSSIDILSTANDATQELQDESIHFDDLDFMEEDSEIQTEIPVANTAKDTIIETMWYKFQEQLVKSYDMKTNHMKINKLKNESKKANIEDNLRIFDFALNQNLSDEGINDLIKLIKNISINNDADIALPGNYETLKKRCCGNIVSETSTNNQGTFDILQWRYRLNEDVLPIQQKCIHEYSYNIMQILSETLLNIDPSKFIQSPDIRYNATSNTRIYEDYTTGNHFERLTNEIRKKHPNGMALSIGITLDDTTTRSGKRTFIPVYLYILNAIDDAFKMILIGFAAGDKLPYSDGDIIKFINENYPNQQGKKTVINEFIRYSKRQIQIDYLYDILKPILETQESGVKFQVGHFENKKSFCIHAFIHLCLITGDNKQLDYLAGTNFRSKNGKCRQCLSNKVHSLNANESIGEFRNDDYMYSTGANAKNALIERCKHTGGRLGENTRNNITITKEVGMKAGDNKLILLFKWQHDRNISSFYKSLVPDYLHTFIKGLIEDSIAWGICVIQSVAKKDITYEHNMTWVDDRIKHFPVLQSLKVFPNRQYRFHDGISQLFKSSWNKKGTETTGFFANGSLEAWKLPIMLMQLLFCINKDICPFHSNWAQANSLQRKWNIGRVLVNSLTSVFSLHLSCRMKVSTSDKMPELHNMITNARAHLSLLRLLKQDLMIVDTVSKDKEYGGIKHHMAEHFGRNKDEWGYDHRALDTELSEKEHIKYKAVFERTNKQYNQVNKKMLLNTKIQDYYKHLNSYNSTDLSETDDVPNDVPTDIYTWLSLSNEKADELIFENNQFQIKYQLKTKTRQYSSKPSINKKDKFKNDTHAVNKLLLSFDEVIRIADDCSTNEFKTEWNLLKEKNVICKLPTAIKCSDFTIHCNSHYIINDSNTAINVCDFVEIKYEVDEDQSSTEIARVICIFRFEN